mmetsp:Transcript_113889/g.328925  ORF Transcript_113889/g.328925 Transcript_113889/m.328925 type:complete len:425 (-) Transcript_113889:95-1369(-)
MTIKERVAQALWGAGGEGPSPENAHPPATGATGGCFERPPLRTPLGPAADVPIRDQFRGKASPDNADASELHAALMAERRACQQKDQELAVMQQLLAKLESSIEQQATDAKLEQDRISLLERSLAERRPADQDEKVEKLLLAVAGEKRKAEEQAKQVLELQEELLTMRARCGGLEEQIQEMKESVELPLTHPELYEDVGIKPPKGVILYGVPGTGKTLLAKAVANETSATFLRVVGSELIQKYLGDGPKLVREMFRLAQEHAPSIVFIDEIDAVATKRYDTTSGGEKEIQRTMLELLNQLDGFDDRGDVKVIMATNRIESLDPAMIRPGRIDRKIEFPLPDEKTKRRIFQIHTSKMTLSDDVNLEEFVVAKDDLSGADIKAVCTEAGMLALRERRMKVTQTDMRKAKEKALYKKKGNIPEGMYL